MLKNIFYLTTYQDNTVVSVFSHKTEHFFGRVIIHSMVKQSDRATILKLVVSGCRATANPTYTGSNRSSSPLKNSRARCCEATECPIIIFKLTYNLKPCLMFRHYLDGRCYSSKIIFQSFLELFIFFAVICM